MNFNRRHFLGAAIAVTAGASTNSALAVPRALGRQAVPAEPKRSEMPPLLQQAMAALDHHSARIAHRDRIGLVDFSAHSREKRFQLIDIASGRITDKWLVAHGRGSDPGHTGYLQRFSNRHGSNATSRGSYLMANPYYGKYGRSQRLIGLDPENDQALDRAIVLHGAPYVDPALIDVQGRIGRSLGCFAVEEHLVHAVMDHLGEGRLLFACQ